MRLRNRENSPYVVRFIRWRRHNSCLDDDACEFFGAVQFLSQAGQSLPRFVREKVCRNLRSLQITALTRLLYQLSVGTALLIPYYRTWQGEDDRCQKISLVIILFAYTVHFAVYHWSELQGYSTL